MAVASLVLRTLCLSVGCLMAALLTPGGNVPPPTREIGAATPDVVHIRHQLVTVEPVAPPPVARRARVAQKAPAATREHTPRRALLAQAKRFVFGDGRVRPEPFPKVGK